MNKFSSILLATILSCACTALLHADTPDTAASTNSIPFEEIQKLIREHLAGATDQELNDAAVKGLLEQLKPHVILGRRPTGGESTNSLVATAARHRKDFGYLRVGIVRDGLRAALREAIDKLLEKGPLNGLVIDLRFTGGTDYAAAASAAGLFTQSDAALLRVGDQTFKGGATNDAPVLIPVMTLTNGSTSGAGEALAAALRFVKSGLIIGGKTSGEAMLFDEFPLSNGQVISIASEPVKLGDGTALPRTGLTPDIVVSTSPDEDRRYLDDPYWEADSTNVAPDALLPHHRITEADLVRQRREGVPLQEIISDPDEPPDRVPHQVKDPVLGRALDMLKALSVVQTWKHEK